MCNVRNFWCFIDLHEKLYTCKSKCRKSSKVLRYCCGSFSNLVTSSSSASCMVCHWSPRYCRLPVTWCRTPPLLWAASYNKHFENYNSSCQQYLNRELLLVTFMHSQPGLGGHTKFTNRWPTLHQDLSRGWAMALIQYLAQFCNALPRTDILATEETESIPLCIISLWNKAILMQKLRYLFIKNRKMQFCSDINIILSTKEESFVP